MHGYGEAQIDYPRHNIYMVEPRVHNIYREGECLTTYIPSTNAMRQVTPVNYRTP